MSLLLLSAFHREMVDSRFREYPDSLHQTKERSKSTRLTDRGHSSVSADASIWWVSRWKPSRHFSGCSTAGSAHWSPLSWDAVHLWAREISLGEDGKIVLSTFFSFFPLLVCLWCSKQDEDQTLIGASAKTGRQAFIHSRSCPTNAYFLIPLCLKKFSQFVHDEERWRERERLTDRDREREITSLCHPEASPKLLVEKQAAVWWIKQQRQPLPSLPGRLLPLIFQSLSVPALCLFYTLPGKWILSFCPLSSLQCTAITSASPSLSRLSNISYPPSSITLSRPRLLCKICSMPASSIKACSAPCFGPTQMYLPYNYWQLRW